MMIRGLEHFKSEFEVYKDNFIIVGGVASYLLLDEAGAEKVRATKDIDIVLMLKPSPEFIEKLKEYVKNGGYEIEKGENDQASFYRFQKPKEDEYPEMIELFATADSELKLFEDQHIIPVKTTSDVDSLSAILLDDEYFSIIKNHSVDMDGIMIINEMALIPFKAKAYLEIKERKEDSKKWKKHRGDIINLAVNFLDGEKSLKLAGKVREHFESFMEQVEGELTADIIEGACKQRIRKDDVVKILKATFL